MLLKDLTKPCIAAVLPCYRSKEHVLDVIRGIGEEVDIIVAVDDACPEGTGEHVRSVIDDPRLSLVFLDKNEGIGGAMIAGYQRAAELGADIFVKLDSDGQMDPRLIKRFTQPVAAGLADYTKGNRFFNPEDVNQMPWTRRIGNVGLSFLSKLSTGYWPIFDPTNGFTAMHRQVFEMLPSKKISRRFFFETDILFRLNLIGAVVMDIPMRAKYGNEKSNLNALGALVSFSARHLGLFSKRIFYNYFLRDLSVASFQLVIGLVLLVFGAIFGLLVWVESRRSGMPATAGTIMIFGLAILSGLNFLLSFISFDYNSVPKTPLQQRLLGAAEEHDPATSPKPEV